MERYKTNIMKIAYIIPSLAGAAPVAVIELLSRLMTNNGHECTVFYIDEKTPINFICHTQRINPKIAMDFTKFDVVHSTGMRPDIYTAKHREYSGKTKYITTIHNFFIQDFTSQYNFLIAQVFGRRWMHYLNKLDTVVTLSKSGIRYYQKWIHKPNLTYAYNAKSVDKTQKLSTKYNLLKFKGTDTLIGVNAMLSPIKGIDQLIKALPKLPNHKLLIVGDGKSRCDLEKLALKYGVSNRCLFLGYQPMAHRYLTYYDIYAMPSRNEGFGLVLLEAAQYKTPTVCSDIPIFKELFTSIEVSFFNLDNINSLVKAIQHATDNKNLAEKMNQRYFESYTPKKMYERYLSIYNGKF